MTLPALSRISGSSEQKTILQTTGQLIQFTVLEIQFRPLKHTTVNTQKFEQNSIPIQTIATRQENCKQPTSNSFETL